MAQYLILIHEDEAAWEAADPRVLHQVLAEHAAFGERNSDVLRGGHALHPTATATTVRPAPGGGFVVTDGAFAETKEAMGGYYVIEVPTLDEAVAVAKQVPVRFGGVEVRPIRTFDRKTGRGGFGCGGRGRRGAPS